QNEESASISASPLTRFAAKVPESASISASDVTHFPARSLSLSSLPLDKDNLISPERAARARACEEFLPSQRIAVELVNRGFPPEEFDGLVADYRRQRRDDDD